MAPEEVSPEAALAAKMEYPFASSPDILRTHQKDAFMTDVLSTQVSSILRALFGARFAHRHSSTSSHLTELLYLCVTTLIGNRTLGEEYCDVIQIEDDTLRLASLGRRLGYIVSVIFAPWILARSLPALRRRVRMKLERNVERLKDGLEKPNQRPTRSKMARHRSLIIQEYILKHLDTFTSLNPIYALSLATFYFTGSYYHISKRIFGLRYIFTKQIKPSEQRVGYEVLGVLLVLQMAVQSTLHLRGTFLDLAHDTSVANATPMQSQPPTVPVGNGIEIPLPSSFASSPSAHPSPSSEIPSQLPKGIACTTQTPLLDSPRYTCTEPSTMSWIPAGQQRKCTLCLEPFRDPSATTCGHVFCWTCVQEWVREKAECPLCRQKIGSAKVLPLR